MMDQRIPFDIVSGHKMTAEILSKYSAILLPNAACLPHRACDALETYVSGGGHVVSTYLSGNFDEMGKPRDISLLDRLIGAKTTGVTWKNLRAAYGAIRDPASPLLAGFDGTDLLPVAGDITFVRMDEKEQVLAPLTLVPPVEGEVGSGISVPEFNKIDHVTDYPMIIDRQVGKGRYPFPLAAGSHRFPLWLPRPLPPHRQRRQAGARMAGHRHGKAPGLVDVSVMEKSDPSGDIARQFLLTRQLQHRPTTHHRGTNANP
jgi:hypothetical protein